jgi:mannosyltransferase OCH1-like enzyme
MSWDSKNPDIPVKYKEFDTILKNLHPDWQVMEWNNANVKEFVSNFYPDFLPTYLSYDIPVKAHDAARYLIVNHFGGVFIQHSIKLQKNIEPLLMHADLVVSKQSKDSSDIGNAFFASIPGHGFWRNFISRDLKIHASEKNVLQATGPDIFTKSVSNYIRNEGSNGVVYLDHQHLFPFDWIQKGDSPIKEMCIDDNSRCFELFPEAYGFCQWSGSWVKLFYPEWLK